MSKAYATNHAACRYCERVNGGSGKFAKQQLTALAGAADVVDSGEGGEELRRVGDLYLVMCAGRILTCFLRPQGKVPRRKSRMEQRALCVAA